MQDVEFTIERGKLFMLQTRSGKRTAKAALKVAVDMAGEGVDHARGGGRAHRAELARSAPPSDARPRCAAHARRARPPRIARRRDRRDRLHRRGSGAAQRADGHDVILVRNETSPEDIQRHGRRARRSDRARRHDQPRGGRRARHGKALRLRRRRAQDRREARHHVGRRKDPGAPATSSPSTAPAARSIDGRVPTLKAELTGDFAHADGLGRRDRGACGCAPTRRRRTMRASRASSARRASASAAPSTCSSTASASSPCAR